MDAMKRFKMITSGDSDLSGLSDSDIGDWLELASEGLDASRFSSDKGYQKTAVHLAAHRAKTALDPSIAGTPTLLTDQSAGDLSESYETPGIEDEKDLTSYGQRYKQLLRKYVKNPRFL
jgi:hypothetical protein